MLNILNFFEETGAPENSTSQNSWVMWVILGVLLVFMIVIMIVPQRKQKKRAEEMMSKLCVGCIVTTIGGIIGEVVQLDDENIWIETGVEGNKTTMQFLRQAIHSIKPVPGSPEAIAEEKAEKKELSEEDEIK